MLRRADWLPDGCRLCLFRVFSTPSSADIAQSVATANVKGTLSQFQTTKLFQSTSALRSGLPDSQASLHAKLSHRSKPSDEKLQNISRQDNMVAVQFGAPKRGFRTSIVEMPMASPEMLADAGIYFGPSPKTEGDARSDNQPRLEVSPCVGETEGASTVVDQPVSADSPSSSPPVSADSPPSSPPDSATEQDEGVKNLLTGMIYDG